MVLPFKRLLIVRDIYALISCLGTSGGPVRVGALSNAGFEKCAIADHLYGEADVVDAPHWTPETKKKLSGIFEKYGIGGIMDVHDVLDLTPMLDDAGYDDVMRTVLEDNTVQAGVFSCVPMSATLKTLPNEIKEPGSLANRLVKLHEQYKDIKPFFVVIESGYKYDDFRNVLTSHGIPTFKSADEGSRVMRKLVKAASVIDSTTTDDNVPQFVKDVVHPYSKRLGKSMPVSAFSDDGLCPPSTSQYEKRGVAEKIPIWDVESCVQCNQCSFMCSHAAIRPFVLTPEDDARAVKEGKNWTSQKIKNAPKDKRSMKYRIQVSPYDCTGCGVCAGTCSEKALTMMPFYEGVVNESVNWNIASKLPEVHGMGDKYTVRGSQFNKPLLEFSGACAGCPQPMYARLLTQLYGDSLVFTNATGCSMIWSGYFPFNPYTVNDKGRGPAWAHSLFEGTWDVIDNVMCVDGAEFGFGMQVATENRRRILKSHVQEAVKSKDITPELKNQLSNWLNVFDDRDKTVAIYDNVKPMLESIKTSDKHLQYIQKESKMLCKSLFFFMGGDGWAYDIGYGGLDHVLHSNENVKIMVYDNEVYSNTGGQVSKSTSRGAIAKFAAKGKAQAKKDLALMLMSTGRIYVAGISIGADKNQTVKVLKEAVDYNGPAIIFAHNPCIAHGIKGGMTAMETEMKEAVACGYWMNFRYNPSTGLSMDSKPDVTKVRDYLRRDARFVALEQMYPKDAEVRCRFIEIYHN